MGLSASTPKWEWLYGLIGNMLVEMRLSRTRPKWERIEERMDQVGESPAGRACADGMQALLPLSQSGNAPKWECTLSGNAPKWESASVGAISQALEPECLLPLSSAVRRLILVGDPKQLPPLVRSGTD